MSSIAPPNNTRGSNTTDNWITPNWLIDRIGPFELDPCACDPQPWACAARQYTFEDNGLMRPWDGFWFCNPPYGKQTATWLDRCSLVSSSGIALVFARTETRMFFKSVWPKANSLLFLRGRLTFSRPDGSSPPSGHNSGGPSVLIAFGEMASDRLASNKDLGALVELSGEQVL